MAKPGQPLRVYLAGPMTDIVDDNKPAFDRAASLLRALGFHVESPAENKAPCENPTLEDWMRTAIPQMLTCNAVVMLPGWPNSKGARLEKELAVKLGMQVSELYEALELLPWTIEESVRLQP